MWLALVDACRACGACTRCLRTSACCCLCVCWPLWSSCSPLCSPSSPRPAPSSGTCSPAPYSAADRLDQAVVQDATLGVSPCQVTEGGEGRRQRRRRARVEHRLCSALGRIGWGAICSAPSPPLDGSDRKTSRATLNRCSRHFHEVLLSTRHLPRKAEFTSSRNRAIYGRPTIAYGAAYALLLYMRLAAQPSALPYHCRPCTPTAPPAAQT